MESGMGSTIKAVIFDNAKELVAGRMREYCEHKGIRIRIDSSVPYPPSSNRVAERLVGVATSSMHAMLRDSNLIANENMRRLNVLKTVPHLPDTNIITPRWVFLRKFVNVALVKHQACFIVMHFDLTNAPTTFQRFMDSVFADVLRTPSSRYNPSLASPNFTSGLSSIIPILSFRLLALHAKELLGLV